MSDHSMGTTPYVFLSYASADRERALALADRLAGSGIRVWLDRRNIVGGSSWDAAIVEAIQRCTVLAVLCSHVAMQSPNILQELRVAQQHRTPVLPLLLEPVTYPPALEYSLAGRQWVELLDRAEEVWLPEVLRALAGLGLAVEAVQVAPAVAVPPVIAESVGRARDAQRQRSAHASTARSGPASRAAPLLEGQEAIVPTGNLPAALTSLVGREQEIAEATRLLAASRLLTLTGAGGSGKTRLSLAVAQAVQPRFRDGAWFVDLAALADPTLVPGAIARSLGVPEVEDIPLLDTLQAYLRQRRLLLVLDNFEQLLTAATVVTTLLAASAGLQVLVTSRVLLRAEGEQEYPVPPLPLPLTRAYAAVAESAAVQLFMQRARAVQPGFSLTAVNAADVADICRRLDGLPLALELAAARMKLLAPAALLARMERRLPLLTGGARTLPQRQQTLQATISWSWDLLSEPERVLFRRLGGFAGGWTLAAAESVCSGDGDLDVFEGLTSLVDQSLVQQRLGADGEPRFSVLVLLREYALARLAEAGETESLHHRHLRYFLALATEADEQVLAGADAGAMARLDAEQGNLREALSRALAVGEAELGLRLAGRLQLWFFMRSPGEGRRTIEALLALPTTASPLARIMGHFTAVRCAFAQADGVTQRAHAEAMAALCRELGDDRWLARALVGIAWAARPDQPQELAEFGGAALALISAKDDPHIGVVAHLAVVLGEALLGDAERSRAHVRHALALAHATNSAWLGFLVHWIPGIAAYILGDPARARRDLGEALVLTRATGDAGNRPVVLCLFAAAALAEGDTAAARESVLEALTLFQEFGSRIGQTLCVLGLAAVLARGGAVVPAARLLGATSGPALDAGPPTTQAAALFLRQLAEPLARAQLGEEAFSAAVAEGQGLTLEQATTLALEALTAAEPVGATGDASVS